MAAIITREMLEARRAEMCDRLEKIKMDANAVSGAIQDIDFWIAQLEKEDAKSATEN